MKIPKMIVMLLSTLFCFVPTSWAETEPTTLEQEIMVDPLCIESKEVCYERAVRQYERARQQEANRKRCIAEPDWCEQQRAIKRERHELRIQCKAYPDKCEELRRQFRERRAKERQKTREEIKQEQEQWCQENPQACKRWKADLKAHREKCRQLHIEINEKYDVPH